MAVQFGIFDQLDWNCRPPDQQYEDRLQLAETYDRLGFRAYHLAEHHSTRFGRAPSPSIFLSAVAQRTHTLRLGPLVYALAFYHPLRVLEEICMLDQLSGGRLELGLGRGISPIELSFYGVDCAAAQEMAFEATQIILQGLVFGRVDFVGKHYCYRGVPVEMGPIQRPHPPLWIGTSRPESTAWAAANRASIVCNGQAPDIRKVVDRYRTEWAMLGRTEDSMPLMGVSRHVVVADTDREAFEIAQRGYAVWHASFVDLWRQQGTIPTRLKFPESFSDAVSAGYCIAGSPKTVQDAVMRDIKATGVSYFLCRIAFGDLTFREALQSATLFANSVMPGFGGETSLAAADTSVRTPQLIL
jgi:alkanesulfonate monooxygenase SsuD/methylene tetrahydromethanopterin reductase-like flavin-dependent oxidoreductase (luciferase family)